MILREDFSTMVDVREIIESDEMRNVVVALDALRQKFSFSGYGQDRLWPVALVLNGKYQADIILQIICDPKPYYPGYKEILAASFAGWLVLPKDKKVREFLVNKAALAHMARAQDVVGGDDFTIEQDIASRYLFTGLDFFVEIFSIIGGYQAIEYATAVDYLYSLYFPSVKPIRTTVKAIAFLHHAVDRFCVNGSVFVPSLNKSVGIFEMLSEKYRQFPFKEKYVARSLLHERWSNNKQTLALLYAASTLRVGRKTLLDVLLDGDFSYHTHHQYLERWVERARFIVAHVFSRMVDQELQKQNMKLLREGKAQPFSAPKLHPTEEKCFSEFFRQNINKLR